MRISHPGRWANSSQTSRSATASRTRRPDTGPRGERTADGRAQGGRAARQGRCVSHEIQRGHLADHTLGREAPVDGPVSRDLSAPALERHSLRSRGPGFPSTAQLVYSRPAAGSPWSLTEEWDLPDNKARIEFQAVETVDPTPDQLKEYAGRYESDELAATYRLAVRDGRLWLRVNSRRWEALEATVRDEFVHMQEPADFRIITFLRNEKGEVTGLSIDIGGRLSGVRFTKR